MHENNIQKYWLIFAEQFNGRVLRERVLILICVLGVMYFIWDFGFGQPMDAKREMLTLRFDQATTALETTSTEESYLVKALTSDPTAAKKRQLARLENQLQALEKDLQKLSVGLIPAEQLPQIVHDVLLKSGKLKLTGFTTNEAQKLNFKNEIASALTEEEKAKNALDSATGNSVANISDQDKSDVGVYRHSVVVSVSGKYFDIRDYLKSLEDLEWTMYWELISYKVTDYPIAEIELEVYTLSTGLGVIGG